jgi:hypothetical protein
VRVDDWQKAKFAKSETFVVGGWRETGGFVHSVLAGEWRDGKLHYVGRARTSGDITGLAAFAGLLTTAAYADTMGHCAAAWKLKAPEAVAAKTYKAWSATCLKADYKTAPGTPGAPPPGATAMCKDNSYSISKTAQGRCSGHGGVAKAL